jgi:DNA-binding MarR family transcriptional regulator
MMRSRTTPVKPLSEEEIRDQHVDVAFLVWMGARATSQLMDEVLAPSGLTGDEFAIYSVLRAEPGITPTELARWMAAPPTTVSSYVKRFERRGHVQREAHPQDGRSYRLRLTTSGEETHSTAAERFAPVREGLSSALADREPAVRSALLAMRSAVDEVASRTGDRGPRDAQPS